MSYSTPDDLIARISPKILLQLAADDLTLTLLDALVLATIQGWCDAADETIDGWISTRYATPIDPLVAPASQFAKLRNWSADIACYNAFTFRATSDGDNPWKARHDAITSKNEGILMKIQSGAMNLDGCIERTTRAVPQIASGFTSETNQFTPPPLWSGQRNGW